MSPARRLGGLVLTVVLVRALVASSAPLLAAEAYYWSWNLHLGAGYFDHPPLIAWITRVFFGGIAGSELAARSGTIVLGALTIVSVHGLTNELFDDTRVAFRAALLFAITPIFAGLGVVLEPDAALLLFTTLTWWMSWRAITRQRLVWWLIAGACAGLALLSKFHAWILLPPLLVYLWLAPGRRALLRTPGPWAAVGVALLVLSPNLVWNAQHDWMNYAFQWKRSTLGEARFQPALVGAFWGGALVALSPMLFIAMCRAISVTTKRWRDDDRGLFLLCAGLPLPLFLALLAFGVKISPHWPSAGYVALLVLTVGCMGRHEILGPRSRRAVWIVAALVTAILYAIPLVLAPSTSTADGARPERVSIARLQRTASGWREVSSAASDHLDRLRASGAEGTVPAVIFSDKWTTVSMLAFYGRHPTDCFALSREYAHHIELWRQERGGFGGQSAIVVLEHRRPNSDYETLAVKYERVTRRFAHLFARVRRLDSVVVHTDGTVTSLPQKDVPRDVLREFTLWECTDYSGELAD